MFNSFGHLFRFTTWGESHGEAIGCVVDGVPSNISLCEQDIQVYLDKRKPGTSKLTTQRKEDDKVKILSGVFDGYTTGTPVSLIIYNENCRSDDYGDIKDKFRPGHADYTYYKKYGIRDYQGGGRSSARETAMRVAASAIARKILGDSISVKGALIQIGDKKVNKLDWNEVDKNPFWSPDPDIIDVWEEYLLNVRKRGSSVGAIVEVRATGVPAGFGEPMYRKLSSDISAAMMSINAVKGVEIGAGMDVATLYGDENADQMRMEDGEVKFLSNNAGGILAGISTGQDIVVRFAVKPTSSILIPMKTVDVHGNEVDISTKGRHDHCIGIRAVPVGEAMMACVLADHKLLQHTRSKTSA